MLQKEFLEKLHHRVAAQCGEELYLSSYSFSLLHGALKAQTENNLLTSKDMQDLHARVSNILNQNDQWEVKEELKAWNAALLREILFFFSSDWQLCLKQNLLQPWADSSTYPQSFLEFSSELVGVDPNSVYADLYSILTDIESLYFEHYEVIEELERLRFVQQHFAKDQSSDFTHRRLAKELAKNPFLQFLEKVRKASTNLRQLSLYFPDAPANPWKKVLQVIVIYERILESFRLNAPLFFESYNFLKWLHQAFPDSTAKEFDCAGTSVKKLYANVVAHLSQATACLVDHSSFQLDSFHTRDKILTHAILANILQLGAEVLAEKGWSAETQVSSPEIFQQM